MKKIMVAFMMAVVMVMSVMVIGPEEAFATNGYVCNVSIEEAGLVEDVMDYYARVLNNTSDGEYTVMKQTIGTSPDGTGYDWYMTVYNHELEMAESDMAHINYDEFDEVYGYLLLACCTYGC